MKTKTRIRDEKGFASVVVALILIVVLALLTVGFAQLARREQQNSLDSQLSTQAFYAAETGVNDIFKLIKNGQINSSTTGVNSGNCLSSGTLSTLRLQPTIDSSTDVSYPCAIVNMNPPQLHFSLAEGDNKTTSFTPSGVSGSTIALTVSWGSSDYNTHYPTSYSAVKFPNSGIPPVIELTIDPINTSGTTTRAALQTAAFTVYLYPSLAHYTGCASSHSCVQYPPLPGPTPSNQAPVVDGSCNSLTRPNPCEAVITNIPYGPNLSYMVHMTALYDSANIDLIGGLPGGVPGGVGSYTFNNAQDVIDVTGKAQNVLKRIQVYLSPTAVNQNPGFAIQAENVCKHFQIDPSSTNFLDAADINVNGSGNVCNLEN